jgi:hypothetical protein
VDDDKECYCEMVNQELTNRKVMEEAQKLESNYGIDYRSWVMI